ncbi:hypothetical protein HBH99_204940 [Parastagonospora nodorum]|nr:hypothetical protein HBH51_255670 [Parastagonospora nodorum]KAH4355659.1 hypothetical protein HBH97_237200 [Parastagonospora nodorum]KAH4378209.1 hypothetical protein HBH99_204940 [Parastagonospora nodorum]KAH4891769.1 hypothetical protein HBH74_219770 [Parastagonospora nodorum]KAH4915761.1 hypothetical protein HBH73_239140 [Parastagonospora nodorum]
MDGCLGLFLDEQLAVALNPLTVFLFFFFFFFFVVALEHANSGWCEGDAAAGVTAHRAVRVSTTSRHLQARQMGLSYSAKVPGGGVK